MKQLTGILPVEEKHVGICLTCKSDTLLNTTRAVPLAVHLTHQIH